MAIENSVPNDFDLRSLIAITFSFAAYPVWICLLISISACSVHTLSSFQSRGFFYESKRLSYFVSGIKCLLAPMRILADTMKSLLWRLSKRKPKSSLMYICKHCRCRVFC